MSSPYYKEEPPPSASSGARMPDITRMPDVTRMPVVAGTTSIQGIEQKAWLQSRDLVVKEIYKELVNADRTAIVLTGLPGIGKSALTDLVSRHLEAQRREKVLNFGETIDIPIENDATFTFNDVAKEIFNQLGKPYQNFFEEGPREQAQRLFGQIRSMETPRLIILKGFDRFLDMQTGKARKEYPVVDEWLKQLDRWECNASRVLLTSHIFPTADDDVYLDRLKEFQAPGVTPDEAAGMLLHWGVTVASEREAREVVKRCGGHAMALKFLADLVRNNEGKSLAQLLVEPGLFDKLDVKLAEKIFDRIFVLLDQEQQQLLQDLSGFREPVDWGAIKEVAASVTKLQSLKERVLVEMDRNTARYFLHPLVRSYVSNKWKNPQEKFHLHDKIAHYYARRSDMCPPREKRARKDDIHPIIEEIRHRGLAGDFEGASAKARDQGVLKDLEQWHENDVLLEVLEILDPVDPQHGRKWQPQPAEEALLCETEERLYKNIGRHEAAAPYLQRALTIYRQELHDPKKEAQMCLERGQLYGESGQRNEAEYWFKQGLSIFNGLGDDESHKFGAVTCKLLGDLYREIGNFQEAEKWYQEAQRRYGRLSLKDYIGEAELYSSWGDLHYSSDSERTDPDQAIEYYKQAGDLYQQNSNQRGEARMLNKLGEVYRDFGESIRARQYYEKAYTLYRAVDDTRGMIEACNGGGDAYLLEGNIAVARQVLEEALRRSWDIGEESWTAESLNNRGRVCDLENRLEDALKDYQQALEMFQRIQNKRKEGWVLMNLGIVYQKQQKKGDARTHFQKALDANRQTNDRKGEGHTLIYLGQWHKREGENLQKQPGREQESQGQFNQALTYYMPALIIHKRRRSWALVVITLHDTGAVKITLNPLGTGLAYLLLARDVDKGNCASRYSATVTKAIEELRQNITDALYQKVMTEVGTDYMVIVDNELSQIVRS